MKDRLKLIVSSFIVYLLVAISHAACGSAPVSFGEGGAGGRAVGGMSSAHKDASVVDALTDPVSEAQADPTDGSRLKAYYLTGDDGSREAVYAKWWDSWRMEDCAFALAADGKYRCLPPNGAASLYFTDASCTQAVASVTPSCLEKYVAQYVADACFYTLPRTVRPLGSKVQPPAALYVQSVGLGSCTKISVTPGNNYFDVGPPVPPTSFVAGTEAHD